MGKSRILFLFGVLFLPLLAAGCENSSRAQTTTIPFTNNFAGSFVNGTVDSNADGFASAVVTEFGQSEALGLNSISSKLEMSPADPVEPCITPGGGEGTIAVLIDGAQVITADGPDQIYVSLTSLSQCVPDDVAANPGFSYEGQGVITGGTGAYAGASGTVSFTGTGAYLVSDESGFFGSSSGVMEGSLELTQ